MFDREKKRPQKPGPLKRSGTYRQISRNVLISCYVASAAIAVIAVSEAQRHFAASNTGEGAFYIALAALGVLFSVFITLANKRSKKRMMQGKVKKDK